jgi:hypothetical protein
MTVIRKWATLKPSAGMIDRVQATNSSRLSKTAHLCLRGVRFCSPYKRWTTFEVFGVANEMFPQG